MNKVLQQEMLVPNIHLLKIEAPDIARKIKPGQFVIIKADEVGERIPLTVADWNIDEGSVSSVFMVVGRSTEKLSALKAGDAVPTFVGPLGRPLEIGNVGTGVCVGGCYGIGSIVPVARAMKREGNRVIALIEARSSFLLYGEEELKEVTDELVILTKDGSRGRKGANARYLTRWLSNANALPQLIVAMGCTHMVQQVAAATKPYGIKTIVSLNPIMVDGTGMCGACRVSIAGETKFACIDGPNFDGHEVDWELLLARRRPYMDAERTAAEMIEYATRGKTRHF